jgi:hypothetical protein
MVTSNEISLRTAINFIRVPGSFLGGVDYLSIQVRIKDILLDNG